MFMQTAHSISEFSSLLQSLPSLRASFDSSTASDALFAYLMKLRLGRSNESIGSYFGINRNIIAKRISSVRQALLADIAPKFVNYERSRRNLLSHTSRLSKNLFTSRPDQIVVIWDATYVYVEKSLNHTAQKKTYNTHKKRNYVKPMLCVATDGTIICVIGPFKATENDASIMQKILPELIPSMRNFQEGDVMLVDRGFRDCIEDFEQQGFVVKIPAHAGGNRQLTTIEANATRLVTKCRFEVEKTNGVMKNTFKMFSMTQETYWVPTLMHDFTIAAALINRLNSIRAKPTKSDAEIDDISQKMLSRLMTPNSLHDALKGNSFAALIRAKKHHIFTSTLTFPSLTIEDLKNISFGIYQINQAALYAYEHFQANNNQFIIYTFPEECKQYWKDFVPENIKSVLVMIDLKSRFVNARTYRSYVLFDSEGNDANAVLGYFCSCKNGLRTVGCCSHVMTLLYYLGFAQRSIGIKEPSPHLRNIFDREQYKLNEYQEVDTDDEEYIDEDEEIFGI